MKILIDDFRWMLPDGSLPDVIFRSTHAFEAFALDRLASIDEIYLDHDLGEGEETGYDFITRLENLHHKGEFPLPAKIVCVSDNGSGRYRIQQVIDNLYKERQ